MPPPVNAESFQATRGTKAGWKVDYFQGIDVAEFNYAPYVQQMKDEGIKLVIYIGPYQNTVKLQQAMQQQGFEPEVFLQDATIYDERYVEQAGDTADGTLRLLDDRAVRRLLRSRRWRSTAPGSTR